MRESMSPPECRTKRRQNKAFLLAGLVSLVGMLIGLTLFAIIWRIPPLRAKAMLVVGPMQPVSLLIVVSMTLAAALLLVFLAKPYFIEDDQGEPAKAETSVVSPPSPIVKVQLSNTTYLEQVAQRSQPGTLFVHPALIRTEEPVVVENEPVSQMILSSPPSEKQPTAGEAHTKYTKPGILFSITLLGEVTLMVHIPGGGTRLIPIKATTIRARLLAYLAVRRGELVHRSKILYHIFAWRREDGSGDDDQTSTLFYAHTKLLRDNVKKVILDINHEAGKQVIDPNVDLFVLSNEHWALAPVCQVVDLDEVEEQYRIIDLARKDGLLTNEIPFFVKDACEKLLAAYPGDFVQDLIKASAESFKPWDGKASWAKRYNTFARNHWLTAKWLLGQYELQQAKACASILEMLLQEGLETLEVKNKLLQQLGSSRITSIEQRAGKSARLKSDLLAEELDREMRTAYGKAIEPFRMYALNACKTEYYPGAPFDEKVSYNAQTKTFGDRIGASEQALRRCLKACAFIGDKRVANEVYAAYHAQMVALFKSWGLLWEPSEETRRDLESIQSLTAANRITPLLPVKQQVS